MLYLPDQDPSLLDRQRLVGMLGGFWSDIFPEAVLVGSICRGRTQLAEQTDQQLDHLLRAVGRKTLRPYRLRLWTEIRLKQSERNRQVRPIYGEGFVYDGSIAYAGTSPAAYHSWPAPERLVTCPVLTNRLADSSAVWIHGADFAFDNQALLFTSNPFDDPRAELLSGPDGPELRLWGWHCEFDESDVYRQWGYPLGARVGGKDGGIGPVNAVYDALIGGR